MNATWVTVVVVPSAFAAEQVRQVLEEHDIPVLIRGLQPGIFGPGFQGTVPGGVDVCVPSPELDRARELVGEPGG